MSAGLTYEQHRRLGVSLKVARRGLITLRIDEVRARGDTSASDLMQDAEKALLKLIDELDGVMGEEHPKRDLLGIYLGSGPRGDNEPRAEDEPRDLSDFVAEQLVAASLLRRTNDLCRRLSHELADVYGADSRVAEFAVRAYEEVMRLAGVLDMRGAAEDVRLEGAFSGPLQSADEPLHSTRTQ